MPAGDLSRSRLTVESDARMLAQRAHGGRRARRSTSIAGDSPLMKRFAGAFASEWIAGGGALPDAFRFDPAPDALTQPAPQRSRQTNPDAVLLAVDGDRCRAAEAVHRHASARMRAASCSSVRRRRSRAISTTCASSRFRGSSRPTRRNSRHSAARLRQRGARAPLRARPRRVPRRRRHSATARPSASSSTAPPATSRSAPAASSRAKGRFAVYRDGAARPARRRALSAAPRHAGARAEALAARVPRCAQGLTIVARNFRTRFGEIDLIARDGSTLVFVEVRMRRSRGFGGARRQHHGGQARAPGRRGARLSRDDRRASPPAASTRS